jgi:RHS repeat-associated protein
LHGKLFASKSYEGFPKSKYCKSLANYTKLHLPRCLGNTASFSYDALNRIVKESLPSPSGSGPTTDTLYAYTATPEGWMISTTDAAGSTVDVQTDSLGRVVSISGDTPTQRFLYWTDGLLYAQIDELNRRTEQDYDERGRLISVTQPTPSSSIASEPASVTSYQYTIDSLLSSVTDPLGRVTSFTHDADGRVTRVTQPDPDGGGSAAAAYTDYVRDAVGNTLAHADALGNTHSVTLDAWFRVLTQSDPDSGVTAVDYDVFGNTLSVTDPLGNVTSYSYNKLNQLVTESKGSANRTFSYDGVGNLRSAVDRNNRLTQWSYDKLYRVTTETWRQTSSPSSTVLRTFDYDYDQVGRLIELADSDPLASDFAYMYDARGQLQLEMQQHRFLGQNIFYDRNYDAVGNQTLLDANIAGWVIGGVVSGGYSAFRNSYSYDRMDRLTSVTQTSRAGGHAVAPKHASFTYDAASQLTDLRRYASTGASSLQVHSRFGRDNAGRLTSITHGGTAIAGVQQWDGSATPPASLGSSGLLAGYTFAYDQASRLTEFRSWADGTQTAYGYDDRSQLVSAATTAITGITPPFGLPGGEGYDFDASGNRKGTGGTSQSATGTHNQLQTDGTYNYTYDGEGNTLTRTHIASGSVTQYSWDHRNRLTSVTDRVSASGSVTQRVEYIYDAFDQRVGKRLDADGNSSFERYEAYVWADGQTVLRFTDSDGLGSTEPFRLASRYLWGDRVDQFLAEEQFAGDSGPQIYASTASTTTGETLWPLTDHLGSVRGLVDNNGIIRQHVTYDSFGNRLVEQHYDTAGAPVSASHAEAVDALFGYTGRDWDSDTNLQYNRARWYDPTTGRWLSQDPIGFAGGDANLYRYVKSRSTSLTDPSGLSPTQDAARFPSVVIKYVQGLEARIPKMSPAEILDLFQNMMVSEFAQQAVPFAVELGFADATKKGQCAWVYVYSEDKGWIDMGHFLTMARLGRRYPGNTFMIEMLGQAYEDASVEVGKQNPEVGGLGSSANTPEDAMSNKLGAAFGAGLKADVPLSEQLAEFFKSMNVKDGKKPWNLSMLPPNEQVWEKCWRANPDKAMRRIKAVMDPNHPFWKNRSPSDPDVSKRIERGEVWGPIAFPDAYKRP